MRGEKTRVCAIEAVGMANLVMNDGVEIVLLAAAVLASPPAFLIEVCQPTERVEVSLRFDLQAAGATQWQRTACAGLRLAVDSSFAAAAEGVRVEAVGIEEKTGEGLDIVDDSTAGEGI